MFVTQTGRSQIRERGDTAGQHFGERVDFLRRVSRGTECVLDLLWRKTGEQAAHPPGIRCRRLCWCSGLACEYWAPALLAAVRFRAARTVRRCLESARVRFRGRDAA